MTIGYDRPLYVLPFDHRGTFRKNMLSWSGTLTEWKDGRRAREEAVIEIARRYREWVDIFEAAGAARGAAAPRGGQS
jgi:hypothetical protein